MPGPNHRVARGRLSGGEVSPYPESPLQASPNMPAIPQLELAPADSAQDALEGAVGGSAGRLGQGGAVLEPRSESERAQESGAAGAGQGGREQATEQAEHSPPPPLRSPDRRPSP